MQDSFFGFKVVNGYRNQSQSDRIVDRLSFASQVIYRSVQWDAFLNMARSLLQAGALPVSQPPTPTAEPQPVIQG
jgi:hypothetical protein